MQLFDPREFRKPRDLLVFHVLEHGQLAQIGLHRRDAAALLGIARDLVDDRFQILARLEFEEILFAELEALGADAQILDTRVDQSVELFIVEVLHPLQRVDHAADGLGALAFLVGRQKKGVDEFIERHVEILHLELDAARNLRQSSIEWIELARRLDLFARELPLPLRKIEAAEDFEGAIVVGGLQLCDLEQLDGFGGLVFGHVILREAGVLRGIDFVARTLGAHFLSHRHVS